MLLRSRLRPAQVPQQSKVHAEKVEPRSFLEGSFGWLFESEWQPEQLQYYAERYPYEISMLAEIPWSESDKAPKFRTYGRWVLLTASGPKGFVRVDRMLGRYTRTYIYAGVHSLEFEGQFRDFLKQIFYILECESCELILRPKASWADSDVPSKEVLCFQKMATGCQPTRERVYTLDKKRILTL